MRRWIVAGALASRLERSTGTMVAAEISIAVQVLDAVKTLFGLGQDLKQANASRRAAMADKFDKVLDEAAGCCGLWRRWCGRSRYS